MKQPPSDPADDHSDEDDYESTSANIALPSTVGGHHPGVTGDEVRTVQGLGFLLDPSQSPSSLGKIRDYEILGIEGRGAMGIVLRAYDPNLRRNVAIKVMAAELSATPGSRERFIREAQSSASINHPNVVIVHSVGEHENLPFLVMEFVEGQTLQDLIRENKKLSVETTLRIAHQIASGLAAAHARGVVHRDVKPANILIENGIQRVKIADFGLARVVLDASGLTSQGKTVGTPSYMAPEQVDGLEVDCRADLFSLGCVIYAMLTGHTPFRAGNTLAVLQAVSKREHVPLDSVVDVPEGLSQLVDRLLKKDPNARLESAVKVLEILEELMRTVGTPSRIAQQAIREQAMVDLAIRRKRNLQMGGLALLAFALVSASVWYAMGDVSPHAANQVSAQLSPFVPIVAKSGGSSPVVAAIPAAVPAERRSLVVVGSGPGADFPTLAAALALAEVPRQIRIESDDNLEQALHISGPRYSGLEIHWQGTGHWRALNGQPVIRVSEAQGVTLRGLHISASATQHGIEVVGNCSGLQIVDCTITQPEGAQTAALHYARATGSSAEAPFVLRGVRISGSQLAIAIVSDTATPFSHWTMEDCQLVGVNLLAGTAIVFEGPCAHIEMRRNRIARYGVAMSIGEVQEGFAVTNNTLQDVKHLFATRAPLDEQDELVVARNLLLGTQLGKLDGHLVSLAENAFHDNLRVGNEPLDWPGILHSPAVSFSSESVDSPDFLRPLKLESVLLADNQSQETRYAGALEPSDLKPDSNSQ